MERALERVEARMAELNEIHQHIVGFQAAHAAALAGRATLELYASDPHRLIVEAVS